VADIPRLVNSLLTSQEIGQGTLNFSRARVVSSNDRLSVAT